MKHSKTILGGIVATLAMTMLMLIAPMMGMPKMNAGEMLGGMMGGSVMMGWIMHFAIGVIFAYAYLFLLNKKLPIANNYLRGAIYGFIVFIFAQIIMAMMGAMGAMGTAPEMPKENMAMMIVGSIMGHLVYGIVLGAFIKKEN
jgi:uncharacterized membrane protein YagU involved in acid resistance